MTTEPASTRAYVLGDSTHELERLELQAGVIGPITRGFFVDAGVGAGMRVLDVGSGAGDVSFLAAELVGPTGSVLGVDLSAPGVAQARERAARRGATIVQFEVGDPGAMAFDAPFDVVLGRYVLQFQRAPEDMLRALVRHVRPGGIVVFHELDWDGRRSDPSAPLHDRVAGWCHETLRRDGTETHMGAKLAPTFLAAGLPAPTQRLAALLGTGDAAGDLLRTAGTLAITLAPAMERLGVATVAELEPATLLDRLFAEAASNRSLYRGPFQVGAWCRKPAD